MLVQTIDRISAIVPPEKCFIVTIRNLLTVTQETLKNVIPASNIMAEPFRKNTAACIAYVSLRIKERYGSGILCFAPADGYVKNRKEYQDALALAYETAEATGELVVVGIRPTYPATGYGYIHVDGNPDDPVGKVSRFVEKPESDTARAMIAAGNFLWNSGILLGNVDTILENIKQFLPEHYEKISEALKQENEPKPALRLEEIYGALPSLSFDTAILEKSGGIRAVRGNFDWDDMGNLEALAKTFPTDAGGNFVKGSHIGIDTSNSVIYSEEIPVATIGVENMMIAVVNDTALICPRNRVQEIKALVEQLKDSGYSYLT